MEHDSHTSRLYKENWADAVRILNEKDARIAELEQAGVAVKELRRHLRKGTVTLLYAARDEERNNAVALKQWLMRRRGA